MRISITYNPLVALKGRPIVTPLFCLLLVITYFILGFNFKDDGVISKYLFTQPSLEGWWRLLKATFVHGNLKHLIGNLVMISFVGYALEKIIGWKHMLGVILCTALGAGLFHAGSDIDSMRTMGGASGVAFGLVGAYAVRG